MNKTQMKQKSKWTGQKHSLEEDCKEDKKARTAHLYDRIIPAIETYVSDIFSQTMRRAEYCGIDISGRTFEDLGYEILSELKGKSVKDIGSFIKEHDSELTGIIDKKLQEFFESVEQIRGTEEREGQEGQREDSSVPDFRKHYEIDHDAAIEATRTKEREEHRSELEAMFK